LRRHNSSFCVLFVVFLLFKERSLSLNMNWVYAFFVFCVKVNSDLILEFDRFFSTSNALLIWLLTICTMLTLRWRDDDDMFFFRIFWKRSFFCDFVYCVIIYFQMHDVFQSIRNFLKQNREKTKKCLRCIDFLIRRRVNVDVALNELWSYYNY
jgi:hypothetical protein